MGFCNRLTFQSKLSSLSKKERERESKHSQTKMQALHKIKEFRTLFIPGLLQGAIQ